MSARKVLVSIKDTMACFCQGFIYLSHVDQDVVRIIGTAQDALGYLDNAVMRIKRAGISLSHSSGGKTRAGGSGHRVGSKQTCLRSRHIWPMNSMNYTSRYPTPAPAESYCHEVKCRRLHYQLSSPSGVESRQRDLYNRDRDFWGRGAMYASFISASCCTYFCSIVETRSHRAMLR